MAASKFEVVIGANNKFQWRLIGPDGAKVLSKDGFSSKDDVFAAIRAVKENAPFSARYERRGEDGNRSFIFKSASHEVIAQGGPFEKEEDRDKVIAVVRTAPEAAIIDKAP